MFRTSSQVPWIFSGCNVNDGSWRSSVKNVFQYEIFEIGLSSKRSRFNVNKEILFFFKNLGKPYVIAIPYLNASSARTNDFRILKGDFNTLRLRLLAHNICCTRYNTDIFMEMFIFTMLSYVYSAEYMYHFVIVFPLHAWTWKFIKQFIFRVSHSKSVFQSAFDTWIICNAMRR